MGIVSIAYMLMTAVMLVMIIRKKEITIAGVLAILIVGTVFTGNPVKGVIVLCSAITAGMSEMLSIFIGISLIVSMTIALKQTSADRYISYVTRYFPKSIGGVYFTIGIFMLAASFMIWPSPAVALIGALMIPAATKAGLPPVYAASSMSIFGYGLALSGDFLIQGVPSITAKGAGLEGQDLMVYLVPLWIVMSVTTVVSAFIFMRVGVKRGAIKCAAPNADEKITPPCGNKRLKLIMLLTFLIFLAAIIAMMIMDIKGDDATALISGTALICTCIAGVIAYPKKEAPEKVLGFLVEGFQFSMKVFAPAIVIIGFFSMGNAEFSSQILGEGAPGSITEFVSFIREHISVPKPILPVFLAVIGFIYSIDGSGFAGLTVIGEVANSFGLGAEGVKLLTALGQIVIIWVGGGTIIPWSMIPVASVCGVDPYDIAQKNLKPVCIGFAATVAAAIVILCVKCL